MVGFTLDQQVTFNHFLAESALSGIAQLEDDLTPYLAAWDADERVLATLHIADTVRALWSDEARDVVLGAYWEERPVQANQLRAWLARLETLTRLHLRWLIKL